MGAGVVVMTGTGAGVVGTHSNSFPQRKTWMGANNDTPPGIPAAFIAALTPPALVFAVSKSASMTVSSPDVQSTRMTADDVPARLLSDMLTACVRDLRPTLVSSKIIVEYIVFKMSAEARTFLKLS